MSDGKMLDLTALHSELEVANSELLNVQAKMQSLRRDETFAINRVNDAQRRLDDAISELRKCAPQGSDWRSKSYKGHPVSDG